MQSKTLFFRGCYLVFALLMMTSYTHAGVIELHEVFQFPLSEQSSKNQAVMMSLITPLAKQEIKYYQFTQSKKLKLFKHSLLSEGHLVFNKDQGLYMSYQKPIWSAYYFDSAGMWEQVEKGGTLEKLPLKGDAFGISSLLSGIFNADIKVLQRDYTVYFQDMSQFAEQESKTSSQTPWRIGLKPKAAMKDKIGQFFETIIVTGTNTLQSIVYQADNGDTTIMSLKNVASLPEGSDYNELSLK